MKTILTCLITTTLMLSLAGVVRGAGEERAAHAATAGTSAAESAGHGESAEDAPQLLRGPDAGLVTAITTLIVFAVLLAVLGKYAWGPIATGLKAREDKIRKDIADAEAARAKAEATLREYNQQLATAESKVRDILAQAGADAEKIATNIRLQAQQEVEESKERATREIEASKNAALAEIYEQAADLSTNIAAKIIRRNLNPQDQQDLVRQSLDQLQTVGSGR